MKVQGWLCFVVATLGMSNWTAVSAHADTDAAARTEVHDVPITRVFIPGGYDSNDAIEIVLDGMLPGPYFVLLPTEIKIKRESREIYLTQHLEPRPSPHEHPSYEWPVAYFQVAKLPTLAAGIYSVHYLGADEKPHVQELIVKPAQTADIDDTLYASISRLFIPELVHETANGEAVISGMLPSNCLLLDPGDIEVLRQDRVIVISPKMRLSGATPCPYSPRSLQRIVPLGPLEPGRYLLHVRSTAGQALNQVFTVIPKSQDPTMESRRSLN